LPIVLPDQTKETKIVSIEADAQKDLALTDGDADGVVGGKRSKKAAVKHKAAPAHQVPFIQMPGYSGTPDDTLPPSDCEPDETAV
jgi:hypothetical protein